MRKFILRYLIPRILQFLTIIFIGITVTFIIPRLSPTDPVEAQISMMMARGETLDPQSIASMRAALTDLYGLSGGPVQQYFAFWGRLLRGDLGPSLANFPTPVSQMIGQAMPYTLSLLITAVHYFVDFWQPVRRPVQLLSQEQSLECDRSAGPGSPPDSILHCGHRPAGGVCFFHPDLPLQRRLPDRDKTQLVP